MSILNSDQNIVRVDIPKDYSLLEILIIPMVVVYFLLILGIFIATFEIVAYFIWYLSIATLILQDRTTLKTTNKKLMIHRRFYSPVILDLKEVKGIKTKKINFIIRIIVYLCIIGVMGYYSYDLLRSIQEYQTLHAPLEAMAGLIISKITLTIFIYVALLSRAERRVKHSTYIEVKTDNGKFGFYPDKPEEFENEITNQINSIDRLTSWKKDLIAFYDDLKNQTYV